VLADLRDTEMRPALEALIASCDVFAASVRYEGLKRLGLDYEAVRQRNPRIIHVSCCGFDQEGPDAARPAYDDLIQGAVGIPSLYARHGGEPRYVPAAIVDRSVGLTVVYTVNAALFYRERSGKGQAVDVPMFETMTEILLSDHLYGKTFEPALGGMGYARMLSPERRPFPTLDGHICVMPYVDKDWQKTFELIGREDLKTDPRFADVAQRTRHIGELYRLLAEALRLRSTEEWVRAFDEADIPAMRLHTPESLLEDPHLNAIGFFGLTEHPSEGTLRTMAIPTRWSESPPDVRRFAPRLGEHSVEVLREAGYADSAITDLLQRGVTSEATDTDH